MKFDENLVIIGQNANNWEEVLTILGIKLVDGGYAKKDYIKNVIDREKRFPTGLPTIPFGSAIPHGDTEHVIRPQIAFSLLNNPVRFKSMGADNSETEVKLVFMLALTDPADQLLMLRRLMEILQDAEKIKRLAGMKTKEDYFEIVAELYDI